VKKKIFIACDTTNIATIKKIISHSKTTKLIIGYKFGLEFFYSKLGRSFLGQLKNKIVWLDLKLKDIPNTVSSSIHALKDLQHARYLTIHASGGLEMMKAAKQAANKTNKKLKILGVTVLTSFSESAIKQTGHTRKKLITLLSSKLNLQNKLD